MLDNQSIETTEIDEALIERLAFLADAKTKHDNNNNAIELLSEKASARHVWRRRNHFASAP